MDIAKLRIEMDIAKLQKKYEELFEDLLELVISEMERAKDENLIDDNGLFYSEALTQWFEKNEPEKMGTY